MWFHAILIEEEEALPGESLAMQIPWALYDMALNGVYTDVDAARAAIRACPPDAVFVCPRVPGPDGLAQLKALRTDGVGAAMVVLGRDTAFESAQAALRLGAFGYLPRPLNAQALNGMMTAVRNALARKALAEGAKALDALASDEVARWLGVSDEKGLGWLVAFVGGNPGEAAAWAGRAATGEWRRACAIEPGLSLLLWRLREGDARRHLIQGPEGFCGAPVGVSGYGAHVRQLPDLLREAHLAYRQRYIDQNTAWCAFTRGKMDRLRPLALAVQDRRDDPSALHALFADMPALFRREGLQVVHAEHLWNFCAATLGLPVGTVTAEALLVQFESFADQCATLDELTSVLAQEKGGDDARRPVNEHFNQLLAEINARFDQPLSLRALSARYYLNLSYASALFSRETGMTFPEYVTGLRMARAESLIAEGEELQAVARRVGYDDYFYFSKVFKKHFGVSPTQYMARMK